MPYIGTTPTKVVSRQSANVYRYTATAGQSVFTGADLDNNVLACNPADMIVHMNGLRLESTDYTATSTSVTLTTAATAGDEVTVTSFVTFEVADTYTKTAADSRYVNTTGDTMTGTLSVTGGRLYVGQTAGDYAQFGKDTSGNAFIDATQSDADFGIYINSTSTGYNKKLGIDSAGRVTMPYQPAFRAYRNTDPGTTTNFTDMTWTSTEFNVGNHFANNKFTAPVAGTYLFGVNNNMGSGATVGGWRLYINGAARHVFSYNTFTATWKNASGTTLIQLQANDYAQAYFYGDADYDINWCGFYGHLIG